MDPSPSGGGTTSAMTSRHSSSPFYFFGFTEKVLTEPPAPAEGTRPSPRPQSTTICHACSDVVG
uniref:Uncharacterized protein n=1 Tax=Oryza brachyantha TaxID=4533 RepID=J3MM15_ORYBR